MNTNGLARVKEKSHTKMTLTPTMNFDLFLIFKGNLTPRYLSMDMVHMCMMDDVHRVTSATNHVLHKATPRGQWPEEGMKSGTFLFYVVQ